MHRKLNKIVINHRIFQKKDLKKHLWVFLIIKYQLELFFKDTFLNFLIQHLDCAKKHFPRLILKYGTPAINACTCFGKISFKNQL